MKSSKSVKSRTIDTFRNSKGCIKILVTLKKSKKGSKGKSNNKTTSCFISVTTKKSSMRPSKGSTRSKKKDSIKKRNKPRVNNLNTDGRPNSTNLWSRA
jgi:hypothetical protein